LHIFNLYLTYTIFAKKIEIFKNITKEHKKINMVI